MALRFLLLLTVLASPCLSQNLSFIETETSCDDDSGMGPGSDLDVTIYTSAGTSCFVYHLDNRDNNFNKCDIDTFREDDIDACSSFPIPGYSISQLRVQHSGLDAWKGNYFRFYFDDGERVNCEWPGVFLDNDEYVQIYDCYLM